MGIGLTEDHQALAAAIAEWADTSGTATVVKDSEDAGPKVFEPVWQALAGLGVPGIAVAEEHGGGGGSFLDLAVAVEACGAAMVPGPLVSTAAASVLLPDGHPLLGAIADGSATVGLSMGEGSLTITDGRARGEARLVWGAGAVTHLLLASGGEEWALIEAVDGVTVEVAEPVDLSTRVGSVSVDAAADILRLDPDRVRYVTVALAAAEAAGMARWALETAVDYAKVREQFGRPIGSFQAIKHLCAEMLEAVESATALAWSAAAAHDEEPDQFAMAAAVAGAATLDAAVRTTQNAIQVLGGIGYTWEHDAHLYLRRAMTNRTLIGGSDRWRLAAADLALSGIRRQSRVDLGPEADQKRDEIRALAVQVAGAENRQHALTETRLLMPHWPTPFGRGAGPAEQLLIDEELAAAGVERPELAIGAWAAPTILEHGDDHQRERFLLPTLRGDIVWCQLFSEPGAGSDLASLRTKAERVEGGWRLSGQKVWTSKAAEADWAICLARTDPDAPAHKGITYFLVDMSSEGLDIRPLRELTGEALFNEVFLDGVFVPDDCVVGSVDGGWALARTTLSNERVAMSGTSLGVSVERALTAAKGAGEAVRLRLGEAVAASATVSALALRSTLRSLAGRGPGAESSVQKLVGVRQRQDSAELALELLAEDALLGTGEGPAAVQEALVTRCLSIAGGTTQVLRNVAAERILGLPRG